MKIRVYISKIVKANTSIQIAIAAHTCMVRLIVLYASKPCKIVYNNKLEMRFYLFKFVS